MPTVSELKAALGKRGLDVEGRKAELEARLAAWACLVPVPGATTTAAAAAASAADGDNGCSSGGRALQVGDAVVLRRGAAKRTVAEGSLRPAHPGIVVQVSTEPPAEDELNEPYQVRGEGGRKYWYGRGDLLKAPDAIMWPVKAEPGASAAASAGAGGDVVVTKEVTAVQRAAAARSAAVSLEDDSLQQAAKDRVAEEARAKTEANGHGDWIRAR